MQKERRKVGIYRMETGETVFGFIYAAYFCVYVTVELQTKMVLEGICWANGVDADSKLDQPNNRQKINELMSLLSLIGYYAELLSGFIDQDGKL